MSYERHDAPNGYASIQYVLHLSRKNQGLGKTRCKIRADLSTRQAVLCRLHVRVVLGRQIVFGATHVGLLLVHDQDTEAGILSERVMRRRDETKLDLTTKIK